jgi:protein-S-isoprenylcysteine O-methyltransferase Ste14
LIPRCSRRGSSLVGACSVVGSRRTGRHPALGWIFVIIFFLGRFVLVLPSVDQPRLYIDGFNSIIGIPIFVLGNFLGPVPCFLIRPLNIAEEDVGFITTNLYKYTRNPIYLEELFWCLGWSITHGSIIGIALVPIWWAGFLLLTIIEEENLEHALGTKYLDYEEKVKGRIIPGLSI